MHCEVVALLHVIALVQFETAVHVGQEVCDALRYVPEMHCEHCEDAASVHVSADAQFVTGEHAVHAVGSVELRQ